MGVVIAFLVIDIIGIFLGAMSIANAVDYFKKGQYYRFGVETMLAIVFIALLVKNVF